jgi:hypothetical protein
MCTRNVNNIYINCECDEYSYGNTRKHRGKAHRQIKVLKSFKINRLVVDSEATGSGT